MKEILIVSDSHKNNRILNNIFKAHPHIDTCIHCGDLQDNENGLEINKLLIVRGNNDFELYPNELILDIENYKIYVTHGHMHDIEYTDQKIYENALQHHTDIILFGHTHDPKFYKKDHMFMINPGSVSFPRSKTIYIPTYAILSLSDKIECHFYNAKTHECVDNELFNPQPKQKKGFFSFLKSKKSSH